MWNITKQKTKAIKSEVFIPRKCLLHFLVEIFGGKPSECSLNNKWFKHSLLVVYREDLHYIFDPWATQSTDKFCGIDKVPFETDSALPFSTQYLTSSVLHLSCCMTCISTISYNKRWFAWNWHFGFDQSALNNVKQYALGVLCLSSLHFLYDLQWYVPKLIYSYFVTNYLGKW